MLLRWLSLSTNHHVWDLLGFRNTTWRSFSVDIMLNLVLKIITSKLLVICKIWVIISVSLKILRIIKLFLLLFHIVLLSLMLIVLTLIELLMRILKLVLINKCVLSGIWNCILVLS